MGGEEGCLLHELRDPMVHVHVFVFGCLACVSLFSLILASEAHWITHDAIAGQLRVVEVSREARDKQPIFSSTQTPSFSRFFTQNCCLQFNKKIQDGKTLQKPENDN